MLKVNDRILVVVAPFWIMNSFSILQSTALLVAYKLRRRSWYFENRIGDTAYEGNISPLPKKEIHERTWVSNNSFFLNFLLKYNHIFHLLTITGLKNKLQIITLRKWVDERSLGGLFPM